MDSNINYREETNYPIHFYIHLFFVFIGFIFYLLILFLFYLYFKYLSLIKREIFTYIILNSFKSFLEITLSSSLIKELIIYFIGCIEFYLILTYINKCLTTKKISQNTSNYELDYLYYIVFTFIISSFPYDKIFNLTGKYIFSYNTINIILIIFLFRYINIKMQLLLEYLKEKKMQNSSIPDIYLPYIKANFYYNNFNIINNIFYIILFLSISYYIIKSLYLFFDWKIIFIYIYLFLEESINYSIIISCLIFFYSFNKKKLLKGMKKTNIYKDESNFGKSNVIDIEIQQNENSNLTVRKRQKEIKKESNLKNDENNEDEEKQEVNSKINEENETLK